MKPAPPVTSAVRFSVAIESPAYPGTAGQSPRSRAAVSTSASGITFTSASTGMKFVSPSPARDDVQVDVVDDPGARDAAEVPAEVVALRPRRPARARRPRSRRAGGSRAPPRRRARRGRRGAGTARPSRGPTCTGTGSRARTRAPAVDDELLLRLAEDAARALVGLLHVLEAPRRPQRLRHAPESRARASAGVSVLDHGGQGQAAAFAAEPELEAAHALEPRVARDREAPDRRVLRPSRRSSAVA